MKRLLAILGLALCIGGAQAQAPIVFPGPPGTQIIPINVSATGTTGSISVTLTGAANRWTYLCGFVITSAGTTAALLGTATVTGSQNTLNFVYNFVSSGQGVLGVALGPGCIVSSAQNTNIVVSVPGGGAGTVVAVTAWGFLN
jgi:hypothetical protein